MWPSHVDALEQTVAVEAQIEDLYAEALHQWIPLAAAAVLPTFTVITADAYTNDDLPPDPDAVASTQAEWDALVVGSILPGVAAIWATAAAEAAAVDAVGGGLEGVLSALTDTRDDFLDVYAAAAKAVPGRIRDNLRSLITTAPQQMSTMDLRSMVRDAVTPGSELLRKTSRRLGYTGASILNHATMAVAKHVGNADRKQWRCVHPNTIVSASGVTHLARRRYKGTLVAVRAASGAAVSLTPQHRVLTGRGWIAAQDLHIGDDLFQIGRADSARAPHIEDRPAAIGDVVDAAIDAAPVGMRSMAVGVDFHGDTAGDDVDVVAADRDLTINLEPDTEQMLGDLLLTNANTLAHAALLSPRHSNDRLLGMDASTVLGGDALIKFGFHVGGNLGRADLSSSRLAAALDTCSIENSPDGRGRTAVAVAERTGRLAAEIGSDDLIADCEQIAATTGLDCELLRSAHLGKSVGLSGPNPIPFGTSPQQITVTQPASHSLRAPPKISGDRHRGLTGEIPGNDNLDVEADPLRVCSRVPVISVETIAYDGHVYDLSTNSHWYTAYGIICHNSILDERTRDTHWVADGQTVPIDGEFTVGGVPMAFPGDPRAPARETANCRCRIAVLAIGEAPRLRRGPAAEARKRAERGVVREDEDLPLVAAIEEEPEMTAPVEIVEEQSQEGELFRTFTDCPIAFIGTPTSDRRLLAKNIELSYRSMPVPLMWKRQNTEGHLDAFTVGVIESMRNDEGAIYASGYLLNTAEADEAATQLQHRVTRPSIDIGEHEWAKTDADGNVFDDETWWDIGELEPKIFDTFTSAEIIAMTLVATPAFGDTMLSLNEARESRDPGLLASSDFTPRLYPAGHFADPKLAEPTRPMLLDDGRVVGHIACWNKPHRDIRDELVYAPRSPSNYSHFHTGAVRVHDGRQISVGRLTVNCRHADKWLPPIPAAAHYDNTECCWALVRAGEDAHGIWFSGVTAPWATPERIEAGLASGLSGDWRNFGLGLDLIAALSVNTPALIVAGHNDAYGQPVSLVAALGPGPSARGGNHTLSHDDIKAAVTEALAEARFIAERDEALAAAAAITRPKTPDEEIDELLAKVRG